MHTDLVTSLIFTFTNIPFQHTFSISPSLQTLFPQVCPNFTSISKKQWFSTFTFIIPGLYERENQTQLTSNQHKTKHHRHDSTNGSLEVNQEFHIKQTDRRTHTVREEIDDKRCAYDHPAPSVIFNVFYLYHLKAVVQPTAFTLIFTFLKKERTI